MGESFAAAAKTSTDAIQRAVQEGVSGIVWMVVVFLLIQSAALLCGAMVARSMFPDSKKKRTLVFELAGLLGIILGGAFVLFTVSSWRNRH
jgi:hypothetical protein